MAVLSDFQAPALNKPASTSVTGIGEEERERRRQAFQSALSHSLSTEEMAHAVRLYEQEFAEERSFSVSEFCQRVFETMPQIQLDKESRLRLLKAMRQPSKAVDADAAMPIPKFSESVMQRLAPRDSACPEMPAFADEMPPMMPSPEDAASPESFQLPEPLVMPSPEDSTSPELTFVTQTPPAMPSPEDSASPELFVLRYANFGKDIIG